VTSTVDPATSLTLVVRRKVVLARDIVLFVLVRPDGGELPPFTAGAHLVVRTPAGVARQYSLCNAPVERRRYLIAVKREAAGEGGSDSMIDALNAGDTVLAAPPRNDFPLAADARRHLLVAGGIGITPILAMFRTLVAEERDVRLVYCTRSPEATAFLHELSARELADRVVIHHDHGDLQRAFDFKALLAAPEPGTHLYCCGPRPLMHAVREHAAHWPRGSLHFEDFGTGAHVVHEAGEHEFVVRLARSGATLAVPRDVSILEVLRGAGFEVPSSCESGTCGTCRTGLLAGAADHRDFVLDDDEQQSSIMICVSRALSPELVLDL